MGEERPESFLLPRPIYPLPSIRYFSRLGGPYLMIISSGRGEGPPALPIPSDAKWSYAEGMGRDRGALSLASRPISPASGKEIGPRVRLVYMGKVYRGISLWILQKPRAQGHPSPSPRPQPIDIDGWGMGKGLGHYFPSNTASTPQPFPHAPTVWRTSTHALHQPEWLWAKRGYASVDRCGYAWVCTYGRREDWLNVGKG